MGLDKIRTCSYTLIGVFFMARGVEATGKFCYMLYRSMYTNKWEQQKMHHPSWHGVVEVGNCREENNEIRIFVDRSTYSQ